MFDVFSWVVTITIVQLIKILKFLKSLKSKGCLGDSNNKVIGERNNFSKNKYNSSSWDSIVDTKYTQEVVFGDNPGWHDEELDVSSGFL